MGDDAYHSKRCQYLDDSWSGVVARRLRRLIGMAVVEKHRQTNGFDRRCCHFGFDTSVFHNKHQSGYTILSPSSRLISHISFSASPIPK